MHTNTEEISYFYTDKIRWIFCNIYSHRPCCILYIYDILPKYFKVAWKPCFKVASVIIISNHVHLLFIHFTAHDFILKFIGQLGFVIWSFEDICFDWFISTLFWAINTNLKGIHIVKPAQNELYHIIIYLWYSVRNMTNNMTYVYHVRQLSYFNSLPHKYILNST